MFVFSESDYSATGSAAASAVGVSLLSLMALITRTKLATGLIMLPSNLARSTSREGRSASLSISAALETVPLMIPPLTSHFLNFLMTS